MPATLLGRLRPGRNAPAEQTSPLPVTDDAADIDNLWVPKTLPPGPAGASGTGVVLDGNQAHRAVLVDGKVTAYQSFGSANAAEALRNALGGTKHAKVIVLSSALFNPAWASSPAPKHLQAATALADGAKAWPASAPEAVACMRALDGSSVLCGIETPLGPEVYAVAAKARAALVPLAFALGTDGIWLVVGAKASWLVVVESSKPVIYRELRSGRDDLGTVGTLASVEIARLARDRKALSSNVSVAGITLDDASAGILARAGIYAAAPPLPGVARYEIPSVEQGMANLCALACISQVASDACYISPAQATAQAEAPARHRRLVAIVAGGIVALGVLMTGLLPLSSANAHLGTARNELAIAQANQASVGPWLALRSQVGSLDAQEHSIRSANPAYAAALGEVVGSAPAGTTPTEVLMSPQGHDTSMTVNVVVRTTTFAPVAAWQKHLEHLGATVVVGSESVAHGTVTVSMTALVPPPKITKAKATKAKAVKAGTGLANVKAKAKATTTKAKATKTATKGKP